MWDGKVAFALIFAVLAGAVVGRIVAAWYRKRVLALMSQGAPPSDAGAPAAALPQQSRRARTSSITQNRRARGRLALTIVAISLAIGLTSHGGACSSSITKPATGRSSSRCSAWPLPG